MKLEQILEELNSFEKLPFLKTIDSFDPPSARAKKEKDKILNESAGQLKNADNRNVGKILKLVEGEFVDFVKSSLLVAESQMDILLDILIRDGNCLMKIEWLEALYQKELKHIKSQMKSMKAIMEEVGDSSHAKNIRIYGKCLETAYTNDAENNEDHKVTKDEQSVLNTLAVQLGLSQEEIKYITYQIIGLEQKSIDHCIEELKELGIAFYSKKSRMIFVADEVVHVLRKARGKEVADKHIRRVLKHLRDSQINLICRKHNIDWKAEREAKIDAIIHEGVSLRSILLEGMHKEGTLVSKIKSEINNLIQKELKIKLESKGVTAEDKIDGLVDYFDALERDEKIGISTDGYDSLCRSLETEMPRLKKEIKKVFELQEDNVLNAEYLMSYNIKPKDLLYSLSDKEIASFCKKADISTRGDEVENILAAFEDSDNLYIENYEALGYRDINELKEFGINLKTAEIGLKFEEVTKKLFERLGLNVDEALRKKISDSKNKVDFVINLENDGIILGECKSVKESGYNKFSSVSRQVKAYANKAKGEGNMVRRVILVAPEFSDEFINACGMSEDLEITLLTASTLKAIYDKFKTVPKAKFPFRLLTKDMVVDEDRILKAIK